MIIDQLSIVRCCQARSREYITLNLNHHVNDDCSKCLQDQITTECNRNVVWLMCDDTLDRNISDSVSVAKFLICSNQPETPVAFTNHRQRGVCL